MISLCKSCRAPIRFALVGLSRMPIDADPIPLGNIAIKCTAYGLSGEILTGLFLEAARRDGDDLHISHFATCPNADRHRKSS